MLFVALFALGGATAFLPRDGRPPIGEAGDAPSVLYIVLDTVRADHFGCYGYERDTTPNLDALAAQGVVFERAISTSPWTLTSHVTLFTGRYPRDCSADWHEILDAEHATMAEVFAERGYATAGFVGNLRYCSGEFGIDRGFAHYEDFYFRPEVVAAASSIGYALLNQVVGQPFHTLVRNDAGRVTDRFLAWQNAHEGEPFFAFLNFYDAHAYCEAPAPHAGMFGPGGGDARDWNARDGAKEAERMQGFRNDYDACLHYIDAEIGRLLETLRERGVLDDTLVVLTADHGEQFGEHGLTGHGNSLYMPNLHVPLLIAMPGRVPSGKRVADFVSLRDVAATTLDLAGALPGTWPGTPLAPLWAETATGMIGSPVLAEVTGVPASPDWIPVGRGDMTSLTERGLHLIVNGDGVAELYDLRADPGEGQDLIGTEAADRDARRLRGQLETLRPPPR